MFNEDQIDPWHVSPDQADRGVWPLVVVLREASQGRIRLTRRHTITARSGRELSVLLDPTRRWLVPYDKTAHQPPVASLLAICRRLRLVRITGRQVTITGRGQRAAKNTPALWQAFAAAVPFENDDYGRDVARFLTVLVAAGTVSSEQSALRLVDHLVLSAGWEFGVDAIGGLNSLSAAHLTLAALTFASAADLAALPPSNDRLDPLAAQGAVLLASSSLANDHATRRPPARTP